MKPDTEHSRPSQQLPDTLLSSHQNSKAVADLGASGSGEVPGPRQHETAGKTPEAGQRNTVSLGGNVRWNQRAGYYSHTFEVWDVSRL